MIGGPLDCTTIMEATNLYLAIRVSNLQMVLALAAGSPPKFASTTEWRTSAPSLPTVKAPKPVNLT